MKSYYLKTVLLAAVAMLGMGAHAQTYDVLYGVQSTDADGNVTIANQTDFTGDANEATGVSFSDGNGNSFEIGGSALLAGTTGGWTKDFASPVTTGKVYFNGDYSLSANNAKTFNIVDKDGNVIFASTSASGSKNGTYVVATICGTDISNYVRLPRGAGYRVGLVIDLDARKVDYSLFISSGKGKGNTLTGTVALTTDNVQGLKVNKTTYGCYLDNVALYSVVSAEKKYAATINYQLDGTTVSTSSFNLAAGATITADTKVVADGTKYFITAAEAPTLTVSATGDNVLNVAVRKAYTATLSLTYQIGGTDSVTTTSLIENDDKTTPWSYAYPLYMQGKDGTYYKADNTATFGESGTFADGETVSRTISYTTPDTDVLFFGDAEGNTTGTDTQYSNGATGYVAAQNYTNRGFSLGTYAAGSYAAVVKITANANRNIVVRDASSTDQTTNAFASTDGTSTGEQTLKFTLTEEKTLLVNGHNSGAKANQSADFDYILVRKIDAPTVVIDEESHLASYSNAATVTVPDDVLVYVATGTEGSTLQLSLVDTKVIPAGQGVLLYSSEGGTKTLAYAGTADATLFAANKLSATADEAVTATGAEYALFQGTQTMRKVKAGVSIPAHKAYMKAASSAARLNLSFGAATGIHGVATARQAATARYNLAGQRVGDGYRGIVVENGKKHIVK